MFSLLFAFLKSNVTVTLSLSLSLSRAFHPAHPEIFEEEGMKLPIRINNPQ